MKLSVARCYALAWRSFAKWWIPLCLISSMIIVFQIAPRILVRSDVNQLKITVSSLVTAISENDLKKLEEISPKAVLQTAILMRRLLRFVAYIFPLVALLTVILLMYANRAVKSRQEAPRPLSSLAYIALVHVLLALGKAAAFLLFFFPGVYLYIRLLFVSLIMLEERKGARAAIGMSWHMTRGNFWELLLLVLMNAAVQILALPTVVGEIPATGFVNTVRAAAFRMLLERGNGAEVPISACGDLRVARGTK